MNVLENIIDPDFNQNIVECGFVKDLNVDRAEKSVSFRLELTTPACPIKSEFERQAIEQVSSLDWVDNVNVTMDAQKPSQQATDDNGRPGGLAKVQSVIAVYSCKGGRTKTMPNREYFLAYVKATVIYTQ